MAARRTPARRTVARKRATTKKGLSSTAKIAIGVGAAAGIYLIWDQFFNKAKKEAAAAAAAAAAAGTTDAAQTVIDAAQNTEPNVLPEPKRQLSPKGTPSKNLKWHSIRLYYGDKGGEIEEMQRQFNAVSKLYNQPLIKIDGIWGPKTEEKKLVIMGTGKGFTLMDVYNEYKANVEGQKGYKEIIKDPSFSVGGSFNRNASPSTKLQNIMGGFSW
jgi:hypothetical protein